MKKQLKPEEERTVLLDAAKKATRELDALFALQEIASIASGAGRRKCSEESLIAANRARKILHRALSKITAPRLGDAAGQRPAPLQCAAPLAHEDKPSTAAVGHAPRSDEDKSSTEAVRTLRERTKNKN